VLLLELSVQPALHTRHTPAFDAEHDAQLAAVQGNGLATPTKYQSMPNAPIAAPFKRMTCTLYVDWYTVVPSAQLEPPPYKTDNDADTPEINALLHAAACTNDEPDANVTGCDAANKLPVTRSTMNTTLLDEGNAAVNLLTNAVSGTSVATTPVNAVLTG
jgi:hypothetical protein